MRLQAEPDRQARVLIAGGGVAGLEALRALGELTVVGVGVGVEVELVCPQQTYDWRGVAVAAGLEDDRSPGVQISELADSIGARFTLDTVLGVSPSAGVATLASGATRSFDVLLAATGAQPQEPIPGAITFGTARGIERSRKLIGHAAAGEVSRLVFAVPDGEAWLSALYELAPLTAARLRALGATVEITLVSHEPSPLALLGEDASGAMGRKLEDHGIDFVAGLHSGEIAWGELGASPGQVRIRADGVVTVPMLLGHPIDGLRSDERGFVLADAAGLVHGTTNVYAAGDMVASRAKHEAGARQQAAAAVAAIAGRLGIVPASPRASRETALEVERESQPARSAGAGG